MKIKIILLTLLLNAYLVVDLSAQEMPLVYDVENTGAECPLPPLPSISELPVIQSLPDAFMWSDSNRGRITNSDDWICRRAEIGAEIQNYEIGTKPPPPENLEASFSADSVLTVRVIVNDDTLTLTSKVTFPSGKGPFPAVIGVGFTNTGSLPSDIFTSRGIATIHFKESQVTSPWSYKRGDGPFFKLFPDTLRGKFVAFAWGVSRIIDGLEKVKDINIDLKRLAITGCSYAGKIALFSGAFDERIALTIAQEPGGGGHTAWRVTDSLSGKRETLRNAQGQFWYYKNVSQFNEAVTKLPYDHHELMAMIAPRALLVLGNPDYEWMADESGKRDSAITLLNQAAELESATPKHAVTPAPTIPAYELLGDQLFSYEMYKEALTAYKKSLEKNPNRFNSLLGAARTSAALNDKPFALYYYHQLIKFTDNKSERSELKEAHTFTSD